MKLDKWAGNELNVSVRQDSPVGSLHAINKCHQANGKYKKKTHNNEEENTKH